MRPESHRHGIRGDDIRGKDRVVRTDGGEEMQEERQWWGERMQGVLLWDERGRGWTGRPVPRWSWSPASPTGPGAFTHTYTHTFTAGYHHFRHTLPLHFPKGNDTICPVGVIWCDDHEIVATFVHPAICGRNNRLYFLRRNAKNDVNAASECADILPFPDILMKWIFDTWSLLGNCNGRLFYFFLSFNRCINSLNVSWWWY